MPIAKIQLKDGRIAKFEVPEGTSQEEVIAFAEKTLAGNQQAQQPTSAENAQVEDISPLESAFAGTVEGLSFGTSDEIKAGIKAPFIYGVSKLAEKLGYDAKGMANMTLGEIYAKEQAEEQAKIDQARQANPKSFLAGEIGGSIGTGIAGAATKLGAKALSTLPRQMATGSAASAGYGITTGTPGERTENVAQDAAMGAALPVLGSAVTGAGKKIIQSLPFKELKKATNKIDKIDSEQLKEVASRAYKTADEQGGVLSASARNKMLDKINNSKIIRQDKEGLFESGKDEIEKYVENINKSYGKDFNFSAALAKDQQITDAINTGDNYKNSIGNRYREIQKILRETIEDAKPSDLVGKSDGFQTYKEARKLWSRSMKLKQIEKIVETAEAATGDKATSLKSQFRTLLNNDKKLRGFTDKEKAIMKKIAKTGGITDIARILGNRMVGAGGGFATGGLPGMAIGIGTTQAARKVGEKLQMSKVDQLIDQIVDAQNNILPQTRKLSILPIAQTPITSNNEQQ